MEVWKDPSSIFGGMYRESGWVMSAHSMTRGWLESARETAEKAGREGVKYMTAEELRKKWPVLTGDFPDWTNLWSPAAGWVPSGQALLRMANAAKANGVKYIFGGDGYVKKLIYDNKGTCVGVISENGTVHQADIVVLSSGSNTATLVEAKEEVVAQTSIICVIQLEPHEVEKYKNIPIIDDFEQGDFPHDGCPKEIEDEMRVFIREMIPELADRPFVSTKLCWDGLAPDLNFRICPYPKAKNLYVATIGSNHGFKFLPVIGKYVADMLEGKLGQEWLDLWKWKFGMVPEGFQDPHPYPTRDLSDLSGWRNRNAPANGKLPWTWSRL
ncbi:putative fructosyl amine:oxygen oxidoreductase protein [Eutypa lata UCREL1]|uniref:Putative fructosyl amine:oxygen oxidoreductase protein n=1 Tax=Eutypa lata (strain UCR-EL1) TaxID=1287681 RepID=M7T089_EUTLA|nr:putative fructosyl amine:oxygen oxidoreductase protein [Eutypa lata UCREL1]